MPNVLMVIPHEILGLGPQELWIILGVLILLFGAKKLPELARSSGQALRIFKSETKELRKGDSDAADKPEEVTGEIVDSATDETARKPTDPSA